MFGAIWPRTASDASSAPTSGDEALLHLHEVAKRFGGLRAVDQLSFSLPRGGVLGVIGPNGAGKSTVVGLIGGSLSPTSGRIFFEGRDISRLGPSQRARLGIARTFQITQPFAGLDVRENVLVGALFGQRGLRRGAAMRLTNEVLERVGLADKANLKASQLTTADRKRLELARALATKPRLLLLDEVMAGLTQTEVLQAVSLIQEINRSGVTIIVIEHIMRAITGVSDHVLVMHHGRKIAEDIPGRVLSDPQVIEAYLGARYAGRKSRGAVSNEL
jgi:branched-chain amino acid transport system ATP-binding protein